MYNIRIKSLPENAKTGSQLNYALVDRNTLFLKPDMSVKSEVKTTETGVPRDEATIEAEGGEVRLTSTPDGYVKLMTITGKSHAQGGEPLKAKPGDFIFSKTKSLAIKDPEVLSMFGIGGENPKSYTPADLAKRYQLNGYVDTLKDPYADVYSKNTAQLMLDNHMKKLGGLALVQESMKGFPDGIPAVAESVMAGLQQQGEQGGDIMHDQPTLAKYGGTQLGVYQKAGPVPKKTNNLPPPKKTITRKKPEGFWDNRGMPSWSQVGHAGLEALNAGTKAETYLGTGVNSLVHTGSWSGNGGKDEKGHKYGAKYMLPSELPSNAHLSRAAKIALDLAFDPINQFTLGTSLAETATKRIATAGADAALTLGEDMAKNTVKNKVSQEVAEAVVKSAGKNVNPRNIEIAKSAVAGASKKAVGVTGKAAQGTKATIGATKGAKWGAIGYDTRNVVEAANKPFDIAYQGLEALHSVPIKQLPAAIAKGAVKGAKAVAKGAVALSETGKLRKGLTAAQSIARAAYNTAGNETIYEPTEEEKANIAVQAAGVPTRATSVTPEQGIPTAVDNRKVIPYNARTQTKPADTKYVRYVAAENSAQLNPDVYAERDAARAAAEQARQQELQARQQRVAEQQKQKQSNTVTTPTQVLSKVASTPAPPPAPAPGKPKVGGQEVEYDPNFAYGGNVNRYRYAEGAEVDTEGQPPVPPKYVVGKNGKVGIRNADGSISENEITKYLKHDPTANNGQGALRLELPNTLSFKEKQQIANKVTSQGFAGIIQSGNQRINPKDPYQGFYSGLHPEDFEDKIVRENYGDEQADKLSPIQKRKVAFDILGIKADVSDMMDSQKLYTPDFIKNKFYPAFTKLLPEGEYRPEMGNDVRFGLEHLDAYKKPGLPDLIPPPKKIPPVRIPPVTPPVTNRDWWLQDRINLAGIMGDRINKYGPTMGHYNNLIPDYALEDPAMMNQMNLSNMAKYQEGLYGSTAGNVAGATAASNIGEGMARSAQDLAGVQNRNVQIYNQASNTGAQIANQEQQLNQGALQKYIGESAIANQQYDNARRNLKWQQIGALNNGITGFQRINQQEDELTPGVHIDPDTGHVITTPYRQMFNEDGTLAYDPRDAYGYGAGAGAGNFDANKMYEYYIKQGKPHSEAKDLVEMNIKAYGVNNAATTARSKKGYGYGAAPGSYSYGAQPFAPYGEEPDDVTIR